MSVPNVIPLEPAARKPRRSAQTRKSGPAKLSTRKWVCLKTKREATWKVCLRMLRSRIQAVVHYLPLAAKKGTENPEYVHQLRVWSRRCEAAVSMCEPLLGKTLFRKLSKRLKRIRQAAGDARNADVFGEKLASLKNGAGKEHLVSGLHRARQSSQKAIHAANADAKSGKRFLKLLHKAEKRIWRCRKKSLLKHPFREFARREFQAVADNFVSASQADLTKVELLHPFRIACKRLRYTIELVADAFPALLRKRLYFQLDRMQAQLGLINDLNHGADHFRKAAAMTKNRATRTQLLRYAVEERRRLSAAVDAWWRYWTAKRAIATHRFLTELTAH